MPMPKMDRAELEELASKLARKAGDLLKAELPKRWGIGFCLIVFQFEGTFATYVSNAEREGMIKHLEEMLGHLRAGRVAPPVVDGGEG